MTAADPTGRRAADDRLRHLVEQARGGRPVEPVLTASVRATLEAGGRALVEAAADGAVYGLTTGVGALRDVALDEVADGADADAADAHGADVHAADAHGADVHQGLRLWRSHAAGFGPELDDDEARATMLARLHQLALGPSAVSPGLAEALERALVAGAVPVLHGCGGIGTGDLTVLAELALALVGEGPWRSGAPAAVTAVAADARPFLSSNASTVGLGLLAREDLAGLLVATERVAAVSLLALRGSVEPLEERVSSGRRLRGEATVAARLRGLLDGVEIEPARVQDPFALRVVPQVHGVAQDALDRVADALLDELDHPRENPLPTAGGVLHHGGFLVQALSAALDALRLAWVPVADLSRVRLGALLDPRLTDLPAFLAHGAPGSSGALILEYVAADLATGVRDAASPAATVSTSVSLGLEEAASHATQSASAARRQAGLLPDLQACELLAAVRALRLDPGRLRGGGPVVDLAREAIARTDDQALEDHPPGEALGRLSALVRDWAIRIPPRVFGPGSAGRRSLRERTTEP